MPDYGKAALSELSQLKPRPIIWITDWWTDVDDVMAARVLLWAERKGMVDIVGVVSSCTNGSIIPSIDAFFQANGRKGVPMAYDTNATPADFGGAPPYQNDMLQFHHQYSSEASAESDVSFFRRSLVNAQTPIDIIGTGYFNNLSNLINSAADSISPLTGLQLIQQKVRHLWIMGGGYPTGTENNMSRTTYAINAAYNVVTNWPTPITFVGYEVGNTVTAGDTFQSNWAPADDLLSQAFSDFNAVNGYASGSGRSSWDPMTMLLGCYGDPAIAGYDVVYGTNSVNGATGANTFIPNTNGKHRYVVKRHTDQWYKQNINNVLDLWDMPTRSTIGQQQLPKPSKLSGVVDASNLVAWWNADDLSTNANGNNVFHIEDRMGNYHMRGSVPTGTSVWVASRSYASGAAVFPTTPNGFYYTAGGAGTSGTTQPSWPTTAGNTVTDNNITWTAVACELPTFFVEGGKSALIFKGYNRMKTDNFTTLANMTVYASVYFGTLPTANNTILSQDDSNTTSNSEFWHMTFPSGGVFEAINFVGSTGSVASAPSAVTAGSWGVVTATFAPTQMQAFLGGDGGTVKTTGTANLGTLPICMGGRYNENSQGEQLNGYIHEVRIYKGIHTPSQIASVVAQMT